MKKIVLLLLFTATYTLSAIAQSKDECISGNCVNGNGKIKYANGNVYDGYFIDSGRNGLGVMVWQNGDKYIGAWKAGYRTGKGKFYFANGGDYDGDFSNNFFDGKGVMVWKNGDKYIGDWNAGQITGNGKLLFVTGDSHEGAFVNGKADGKGTKIWKDGRIYIGDWKTDNLMGFGTLTYANGDKYEGGFVNNERHGKGKYIYANGKIDEGDFVNNKFIVAGSRTVGKQYVKKLLYVNYTTQNVLNEEGKLVDRTTRGLKEYTLIEYEGDFVNGIREGNGTLYTYPTDWEWDAIVYEGEFKNGKENGEGYLHKLHGKKKDEKYQFGLWKDGFYIGSNPNRVNQTIQNGDKYVGLLKNGNPEGKGQYTWKNQNFVITQNDGSKTYLEYYDGDWKDGKFHDKGLCIYGDGTRYSGNFVNGKREGKGELFKVYIVDKKRNTTSYTIFEGEWKNDKFHGEGLCIYGDSTRYSGNFVNGLREGKGRLYKYYIERKRKKGEIISYTLFDGEWKGDKFIKPKDN